MQDPMMELYQLVRNQIVSWEAGNLPAVGIAVGAGIAGFWLLVSKSGQLEKSLSRWTVTTSIWILIATMAWAVSVGALFQFYMLSVLRLQFHAYQLEKILEMEWYGLGKDWFFPKDSASRSDVILHRVFVPNLIGRGFVTRFVNTPALGLLLNNILWSAGLFGFIRSTLFRKRNKRFCLQVLLAVILFFILCVVFYLTAKTYPFPIIEIPK